MATSIGKTYTAFQKHPVQRDTPHGGWRTMTAATTDPEVVTAELERELSYAVEVKEIQ